MTKVNFLRKQEALKLWFDGFSGNEISEKTGLSEATVSRLVSFLPHNAIEARDMRLCSKEVDLGLPQIEKGAFLFKQLEFLGVSIDKLGLAITGIIKVSKAIEYPAKEVVGAATKIAEIEADSGRSFKETVPYFEFLTEQIEILEETKKNSEGHCDEALRKEGLTEEIIIDYSETEAGLRRYGLTMKEPKNILNTLRNVEEMSCNPEEIASSIKQEGSLTSRLKRLSEEVAQKKFDSARAKDEYGYYSEKNPELEATKQKLVQANQNLGLMIDKKGYKLDSLVNSINGVKTYLRDQIKIADSLAEQNSVKGGYDSYEATYQRMKDSLNLTLIQLKQEMEDELDMPDEWRIRTSQMKKQSTGFNFNNCYVGTNPNHWICF